MSGRFYQSTAHLSTKQLLGVAVETSTLQMSRGLRTNYRYYLLIGLVSLVVVLQVIFFAGPHARPAPTLFGVENIAPTPIEDQAAVLVPEPSVEAPKSEYWARKRNLAQQCVNLHSLDDDGWTSLSTTTLHVVYFMWMPNNGSAERIIPGQLEDVKKSGLFDRPFTKFYVIVSAQNTSRLEWLNSLDVIKQYRPEIHHTTRNTFEFPGIRFLYELGCKNPNDLFLYFHNKGVRYYRGRIGMEVVLTREIVANWKNMLTLIAAHPTFHTFGLGGPGYQWMNFYYARGSLFPFVPKPLILKNRWWYEEWCGYDIAPFDVSLPKIANSECSTSTGFQKAVAEPEFEETFYTRRNPQYGILRCGSAEVDGPQLDAWSKPMAKSADAAFQLELAEALKKNAVQTDSVKRAI